MQRLKAISLRIVSVTILMICSTLTAFAAAGDFTVTGGDPNAGSLPTVGASSVLLNDVILHDVGGDDVVTDPVIVKIVLNTTDYSSVYFDNTITPTVAGSCGYTTVDTHSYESATYPTYVDITISGGTNCGAGELVNIVGLKVKTQYAQTAPSSTWLVKMKNVTTSPGSFSNSGTTIAYAVTAADASASVEFGTNSVVGDSGNTTITLNTTALDAADVIKVVFPDFVDISAVDAQVATGSLDDMGGTITCQDSSQTLTCTVSGGATATTGTIILTGITTKYVATTNISDVQVEDEGIAANDITTDSAVALTDSTVGDLSTGTIFVGDMTANQYNKHTITFTTTASVVNLGRIRITYPAGWDISGATGVKATGLSGLDGVWTVSVSGQDLILTQTGGSITTAGLKSLKIEGGIKTPTASGSGGNITILTEIADGSDIETKGSISTGTVVPGVNGTDSGENDTPSTTTNSSTPAVDTSTDTTTTTDTTVDNPAKDTTTTTEDKTTDSSDKETLNPASTPVALSDIEKSWANTEIQTMADKGIVKGNADGTFKPEDNLNRADSAILICRVMKVDEKKAVDTDAFSDAKKDAYYGSCVSQLKADKVVNGKADGTFKPGDSINRAEFIALALRAYGTLLKDQAKTDFDASMTAAEPKASFKDVNGKDWYANVAATAKDNKFVNGRDGNFDGAKSITRAEATTVLYRIFKDLI